MDIFDIKKSLENITILYDTREQQTEKLKRRLEQMEVDAERVKLDYGDYSIKCPLPDGQEFDFSNKCVVERKMSIDELAMCLGTERDRFEREFKRAQKDNCKIYLLIEDATWEKIFNHKYRSKMTPFSIVASLFAWIPRYNMIPIFCKSETSGKIIKEILYRELKEYLENEQ